MKKTFLFALAFFFAVNGFCQFNTVGQKMLTGQFGGVYASDGSDIYGTSYTNPYLSVGFGKFKKPNHLSTLLVNASYTHVGDQYKSYSLGIGYRCTKLYDLKKGLYFGLSHGPEVAFGETKYEPNVNSQFEKINSYQVGYSLEPQLYYQVSKRWVATAAFRNLLSANVGYRSSELRPGSNPSAETHRSGIFADLNVGLLNEPLYNTVLGFGYLMKKK